MLSPIPEGKQSTHEFHQEIPERVGLRRRATFLYVPRSATLEVKEHAENLQASQSTLSEMILQVSATAEESTAISEEVASSANEQLGVSTELVQTSEKLSELSNELRSILSEFVTAESQQESEQE